MIPRKLGKKFGKGKRHAFAEIERLPEEFTRIKLDLKGMIASYYKEMERHRFHLRVIDKLVGRILKYKRQIRINSDFNAIMKKNHPDEYWDTVRKYDESKVRNGQKEHE